MGLLSSAGTLLTKVVGRSGATVLLGSGLSLASYAAIATATSAALASAVSFLGAMPQAMLQLVLLAGTGQALSIIGAALLTRAAINAASLGITKAA